jgi:hypothetical protein
MKSKALNSRLELIVMVVTGLIVLIPLLYGVFAYAISEDKPKFELVIDKPNEQCVRDSEYMRINHMDLLKDVRDEVVREGKRGAIELNGCRSCHASRAQFCDTCHSVVGAQLNCFGCHYYPESATQIASGM